MSFSNTVKRHAFLANCLEALSVTRGSGGSASHPVDVMGGVLGAVPAGHVDRRVDGEVTLHRPYDKGVVKGT